MKKDELNERNDETGQVDQHDSILSEAQETVTDRDDNYGSPVPNHRRIARLWEGYLDLEQGTIEAHDAAVMLGLLKDARIRENPDHRDNWVDKAGYAQCGVECVNDE